MTSAGLDSRIDGLLGEYLEAKALALAVARERAKYQRNPGVYSAKNLDEPLRSAIQLGLELIKRGIQSELLPRADHIPMDIACKIITIAGLPTHRPAIPTVEALLKERKDYHQKPDQSS